MAGKCKSMGYFREAGRNKRGNGAKDGTKERQAGQRCDSGI